MEKQVKNPEDTTQVDVTADAKAMAELEAKAKAKADADAKAKADADAKAKEEAETFDEDGELAEIIDEAKRIFKMHPQASELHFASDGTAFFEPFPAKNYANKLKDKEVTVIKRKSLKF